MVKETKAKPSVLKLNLHFTVQFNAYIREGLRGAKTPQRTPTTTANTESPLHVKVQSICKGI